METVMISAAVTSSRWLKLAAMLGSAVVLAAASGCGSGKSEKTEEQKAPEPTATAQNASGPDIDLNCVVEHLQNPPESFHYSFHKTGDNFLQEDADVTPQTIEGSFKNDDFTNTVRGVRSDEDSWHMAWGSLMGIGSLASSFALVHSTSAEVREASESMNGYDTVRFSIDTSRATPEEAALYKSTLGAGGFEKGMVWVTSAGCPVKITLDEEIAANDGSVSKTHYEEAMVKVAQTN
jgi:hypothetical protein